MRAHWWKGRCVSEGGGERAGGRGLRERGGEVHGDSGEVVPTRGAEFGEQHADHLLKSGSGFASASVGYRKGDAYRIGHLPRQRQRTRRCRARARASRATYRNGRACRVDLELLVDAVFNPCLSSGTARCHTRRRTISSRFMGVRRHAEKVRVFLGQHRAAWRHGHVADDLGHLGGGAVPPTWACDDNST